MRRQRRAPDCPFTRPSIGRVITRNGTPLATWRAAYSVMASTTCASLGNRTDGHNCNDTSDSTRGVGQAARPSITPSNSSAARTDCSASARPPFSTNVQSGKSTFSCLPTS
ncbi:hypothetical protein G6F57_016615 [Rhizopus arrhizus]|nr:hypothetical protein G6F57_016615 [Rhizopus arrhizus]